jgi:hypothetical protein
MGNRAIPQISGASIYARNMNRYQYAQLRVDRTVGTIVVTHTREKAGRTEDCTGSRWPGAALAPSLLKKKKLLRRSELKVADTVPSNLLPASGRRPPPNTCPSPLVARRPMVHRMSKTIRKVFGNELRQA